MLNGKRMFMNPYATIIVVALVGEWLLECVADILNLRAFPDAVPAEFADTYGAEDYAKAKRYSRATTRFGWLASAVKLAALLVFWWAGGFRWLDDRVVALLGEGMWQSPVVRGLFYITLLVLLRLALSLPFSVYDTFVIEQRFGFNKTTPATFAADLVKGAVLGALLGWPLLAAVLWFFAFAGAHAWLYCWAAVVAFTLLVQYIAPTWIMPLFNTFTPLADGPLKEKIHTFARRVDFPLRGVYVIDGSRRSTKANAFFTGFGKNKRIALYDTLLEKQTDDQLVAILAHEIGHCKKRHVLLQLAIGIVHAGAMLFLLGLFLRSETLFAAFGFDSQPVYAGLIFFSLLFSPVNLLLGVALNALSRTMEYQADRFAVAHTGQPGALAEALKKLSKDSLAELAPHPLLVVLHYSHPPILDRLAAIFTAAKK